MITSTSLSDLLSMHKSAVGYVHMYFNTSCMYTYSHCEIHYMYIILLTIFAHITMACIDLHNNYVR